MILMYDLEDNYICELKERMLEIVYEQELEQGSDSNEI